MTAASRYTQLVRYGRIGVLLALEGAGMAALFLGTGWSQLVGFLLGHGAAAAGAVTLWPLLPTVYRDGPAKRRVPAEVPAGAAEDAEAAKKAAKTAKERERIRRSGKLFLVVQVLFLPGVGLVGLLVAMIPALHRPYEKREQDWRRIVIPPLPSQPAEPGAQQSPVAGGRSLTEALEDPATGLDDRLAAVLALRALPTRVAVPILRMALSDSVDDVRLLAYAMLDRRDGQLQVRIQNYQRLLERSAGDAAEAATAHLSLAQLYWELAYAGLVTGAVEVRTLETAARHTRAALEGRTDAKESEGEDAKAGEGAKESEGEGAKTSGPESQGATGAGNLGALFLLGRILLAQGQLDEARRVLEQARARGMSDPAVRPYLAEIAFRQRAMGEVRAHLAAAQCGTSERPGVLARPSRYWLARQ